MKKMLLAVVVVSWMVVTLAMVTRSSAQDEAPLENITTIDGKVVPGAGVYKQEFFAYGRCYILNISVSQKNTCQDENKLACLRVKGQFVCMAVEDFAMFTFFPINGKEWPPFEAVGFSSDEKHYPSGGTYHLAECPPEDYE